MLGLFNIFGRSGSLKAVDHALREFGVHPAAVPEAVKLAAVRLVKEAPGTGVNLSDAAYADAAELVSYCVLGHEQFMASNTHAIAMQAGERFEAAIDVGDGLDANLILLTLNAGIISPELAQRFDVESE